MSEKSFEEMLNDPVMGRAFQEIAQTLRAEGVSQGTQQNNNGNTGSSGMPTDNARGRDITQDRPNPSMPTYELATATPVLASEQTAIRETGANDLSWHHDLKKEGAALDKGDQGQANENAAAKPTQGQAPQQEHGRDPQGRGR